MRFIGILAILITAAVAQDASSNVTNAELTCDNGGSETACRCDDGNCYKIGADVDCNLPVGEKVDCNMYYDMSD